MKKSPAGTKKATPAKKAAPAAKKKAAPAKKPTAPGRATPAKKAAPATKKSASSAKKAAPAKARTAKAPTKKATVTKSTPVKKSTPAAKKAAPTKKPAPAPKAAAKKAAPAKKAPVATKAAPAPAKVTKKAAPAPPKRPTVGVYAKDTKFLDAQRVLLHEERTIYAGQALDLRAEADSLALEREPGDVQFDEESGEGGTVTVDRERNLALSAQASAAVEEIDDALRKIDRKSYGGCERCFKPIPKARLQALPFARLCVACKSGGLSSR
ncbi:MAG TPA: TraR/DksA family transcriptional regulator [Acidimicrobiales bacterium]